MHRNESQTKNDNAENISLSDWQDAVALIAAALNTESQNTKGYQYAVIGSGAYVLHGTAYENPKDNPADIDITTTNPAITRKAILELQH